MSTEQKNWTPGTAIEICHAREVLTAIDAGLISGNGKPKLGKMCVENAVCYGLGLPHSDDPVCVSRAVREFKISINDMPWSSNKARAKGMRRLGIAQLGSNVIDDTIFNQKLAEKTIQRIVPFALRAAASLVKEPHKSALETAAKKCETTPTKEVAMEAKIATKATATANAYASVTKAYTILAASDTAACASAAYDYAYAPAAYAARAAAYAYAENRTKKDEIYTIATELAVDVLREMSAPGIALMDELIPPTVR